MDAPDWDAGWIVFEDTNRNGTREAGEPLIRREGPAHRGVSIAGNGPVEHYVSYTSLGHARRPGGALQMGTFVVCKAGRQPLRVILAHSGRVADRARTRPLPLTGGAPSGTRAPIREGLATAVRRPPIPAHAPLVGSRWPAAWRRRPYAHQKEGLAPCACNAVRRVNTASP